jgi:hypothetical protein
MRWLAVTLALLAASASFALWIYLRDRGPVTFKPATPATVLRTSAAQPDRRDTSPFQPDGASEHVFAREVAQSLI